MTLSSASPALAVGNVVVIAAAACGAEATLGSAALVGAFAVLVAAAASRFFFLRAFKAEASPAV